VISREGKKTCYCPQHPVFKEKSSTARTRIAFGESAKFSNGTQHEIDEYYSLTDSSIVLTWIEGPSNRWKTFVGNKVVTIQEESVSTSWRHVPSQSNLANLISRGVEPATLSTSTLWWKGPQWLTQEPFSWPATEVNTPTEHMEVRNVHGALLQPPEDFTQRLTKLNKLIRVIAYCRSRQQLQTY
jgi:hypothetical protein